MQKGLVAAFGVCVLLIGLPAVPSWADRAGVSFTEQRAIDRINIAARQRYFVQKIAKSICYTFSAHRPQENAGDAWSFIDQFDDSLATLIAGDDTLQIARETDANVLDAVASIGPDWHTFTAAARQIVSGDWHNVPISQFIALNDGVLADVNGIVDQIATAHSAAIVTQKAHVKTINLAGRQRMLTQKAAKEMCFVSLDIDTEKMRAALAQTIDLFETSLNTLEEGVSKKPGTNAQNDVLLAKISEIRELWKTYRAPLAQVAGGGDPAFDDVAFVEATSAPLFELSNELVQLFVKK